MITLDSNECIEGHIGHELIPLLSGRVSSRVLECADLCFDGIVEDKHISVGLEFKHYPSDAFASLRDGRLVHQPIRMLEFYDVAYIVFIGHPMSINLSTGKMRDIDYRTGQLQDAAYSWHWFNSALMKFEAGGGHIRHVPDIKHLAAFVLSQEKFWNVTNRETEVFVKKKILNFELMNDPLAEIYERMGIGIKRALKLAKVAPDLQILVQLTNSELFNIPGFGRGSVKKVRDFVGSRLEGQEELS